MGSDNTTPYTRDRGITVAIVDDHGLLVDSLGSWINENAPELDVVLQSTSWSQCLASERFPTQLVLMDYHLTEPVSIEARLLTCRAAGAKVIVMSAFGGPVLRNRIMGAGADGFFEKSESMADVLTEVRRIFGIKSETGSVPPPRAGTSPSGAIIRPKLSAGEQTALVLYAKGRATKGVAEEMNVQYETAKTFLRRVREKYARAGRPASKRAELVRRAAEDGYLT